jgi:hypothetical protein
MPGRFPGPSILRPEDTLQSTTWMRTNGRVNRVKQSRSIPATFERKATFDTWVTQNHGFRQQLKCKWDKIGLRGVSRSVWICERGMMSKLAEKVDWLTDDFGMCEKVKRTKKEFGMKYRNVEYWKGMSERKDVQKRAYQELFSLFSSATAVLSQKLCIDEISSDIPSVFLLCWWIPSSSHFISYLCQGKKEKSTCQESSPGHSYSVCTRLFD